MRTNREKQFPNKSIVEEAALEWFGDLGYAGARRSRIAPGEPTAKRQSLGKVVLADRLREALRRFPLNCLIPSQS